MQSLLQPIYEHISTILQPIYDLVEQMRFLAAVIIAALAALCFAQTLENRATAVSRAVYLLVLWLILPVVIALIDSFYNLLGFDTRESMTAWSWLITPTLLGLLCASYAAALFYACCRKKGRNLLDILLFTLALCLMAQRAYSNYYG